MVSSLGVDIHNFDNLFYMILFLIISGFITILTVITFFIMFRKMDQFEDKLGIDISILDNH